VATVTNRLMQLADLVSLGIFGRFDAMYSSLTGVIIGGCGEDESDGSMGPRQRGETALSLPSEDGCLYEHAFKHSVMFCKYAYVHVCMYVNIYVYMHACMLLRISSRNEAVRWKKVVSLPPGSLCE
jgi:hypothetical protein